MQEEGLVDTKNSFWSERARPSHPRTTRCGWWRVAMGFVGLLVMAPSGLEAQGVRYDNMVIGPRGTPAGGATVAVCTAGASTSTTPCSPLATVYSDEAMTEPTANPMPADSLGNYGFWAAPGHYLVEIYGSGLSTKEMDVFLPCDPANCLVSNATFSSITTGNLNLTGGLTVNGRGVATKPLPSDEVVYVSPNGSDSNDGLSWGTAKLTVPAACAALPGGSSNCSAGAGMIWVSPGWTGTRPTVSDSSLHVYYLSAAIGGGGGGEAHVSDGVYYVSPNGADTNDGLSWGTAFQTLYQAVGVLESASVQGGTLYVAANTACGGTVSGQGLWLDTTDATLPNGFIRANYAIRVIGVGAGGWTGNSHTPVVNLNCGSSTQPALKLTSVNRPEEFDNLNFSGMQGAVLNAATTQIFRNDNFNVDRSVNTNGPALSVGASSFWLYFYDCLFQGNFPVASAGSDASEAVVLNPNGGASIGLTYFVNAQLNSGDLKYYVGNTSASLVVDGLTTENQIDGHGAVWFPTGSGQGDLHDLVASLDNISVADASGCVSAASNDCYSVENDGTTGTDQIVAWGVSAYGPMTVVGSSGGFGNYAALPLIQGDPGPFGAHSFWQTDAGRRMFSPVALPWPNLTNQAPSTWTVGGGTGVSATAVAAPDGTNNAGQLANTGSSLGWMRPSYPGGVTLAVGDYLIFGAWVRGTANNLPNDTGVQGGCGVVTSSLLPATDSAGLTNPAASGEWEWWVHVLKVTTGGTGCNFNFNLRVNANTPSNGPAYFAPIFLHIPSGQVTDSEAALVGLDLASYPDSLNPPVEATLRGHPFAFGGSGDNYFATLDHTALTANQTYTFPNTSGTLALALVGTTGAIGGSSLAAGACTTGTASVSGATTAMAVAVSPAADPGSGFTWEGWVSAAGTVTVRVCNVSGASATPTAGTYNVRVVE